MAKIKVDTTALEKKLGTMNDKINAIKESIDDIDKEMQKVEKYWKGDASKLFLLNYAKTDISLGSMMDILTESKNEMQAVTFGWLLFRVLCGTGTTGICRLRSERNLPARQGHKRDGHLRFPPL